MKQLLFKTLLFLLYFVFLPMCAIAEPYYDFDGGNTDCGNKTLNRGESITIESSDIVRIKNNFKDVDVNWFASDGFYCRNPDNDSKVIVSGYAVCYNAKLVAIVYYTQNSGSRWKKTYTWYITVKDPDITPVEKTVELAAPGTLSGRISSSDKNRITHLTIIGEINGTDIKFLREMAGSDFNGDYTNGNLRFLDMRKVTIKKGGDAYVNAFGEKQTCTTDRDLPDYAFAWCPKLTEIYLPENSGRILDGALLYIDLLESVHMPEGLVFISYYNFDFCRCLKSLTFPKTVKFIDSDFSGSKKLTTIYCYAVNPPTMKYSFSNTNIQNGTLYVPKGCRNAYLAAKGWMGFGEIKETLPDPGIVINSDNFPDNNFCKYLSSRDEDKDGAFSDDDISNITYIDVDSKEISSLKGIEYFTSLRELHCSDNQLTSLDVSKNTALTKLSCSNNQLTSLDISNNTALTLLYCENNKITSLDISKNTELTQLFCSNNQLTSLEMPKSKNTTFVWLSCARNQLKSLDLSNNLALTFVTCGYNQLCSLDISNNTALYELCCFDNKLDALDVSNNAALEYLECDNNQLTSLDVSNNTALRSLYCNGNKLDALDMSNNTALRSLYCYENKIKGQAMDNLIQSLHVKATNYIHRFYAYNPNSDNEGNGCTPKQVDAVKSKGWIPCYRYNSEWVDFEGIDDDTPVSGSITPTDISKINNVIYINKVESTSGSQLTISLRMKNKAPIRGFQFDLYLPDGVKADKNNKGRITASLSKARLDDDDEHTLTVAEQSDGAIRFLCGSQYNETFSGNDGEVATITVNIDGNMKDGDYPITLKDVKLTETDISKYYETPEVIQVLTISSFIPGDINGDGKVDVSDYIGVANHIMGNTPAGFIRNAADVDGNGTIDVSDYIGIANIIMTGNIYGSSKSRVMMRAATNLDNKDNIIYVAPLSVEKGTTTANLSIGMKNSAAIRGFQFDLYLPDNVTAAKNAKGRIVASLAKARLADDDEHTLTVAEQTDGAIRFLCGSQYDESFIGNDGEVVTLTVNLPEDMAVGDYPIILKNIKLTETDISKYYETESLESTLTIIGEKQDEPKPDNKDNVIYVTPLSVGKGTTTANLSICMKNNADIRGFQFDLYLPDNVTAAKNAKGRIIASLAKARLADDDEHTLTVAEQADGAIRFLCGSQYDETFLGNDGEVVTLTVNLPEDMTVGDYPIILKNIKLTETDISKYYETESLESTLTISSSSGINTIVIGNDGTNNTVYSLSGQKLEKPRKGINIIGGKKVAVK